MKKNGFTLVEIMVVVMIIGLLASIATPMYLKSVQQARIKQAQSELAILSSCVAKLAWDTSRWPNGELRTSAGGRVLDLSGDACGLAGNDGTYDDWQGPYYAETFVDPWGRPYFFDPVHPTKDGGTAVVVGSLGPNGTGQGVLEQDNIIVSVE